MAFPAQLQQLYADYDAAKSRLKLIRSARRGGLGAHVSLTLEPADPTSPVDQLLVALAAEHQRSLMADIGARFEADAKTAVETIRRRISEAFKEALAELDTSEAGDE